MNKRPEGELTAILGGFGSGKSLQAMEFFKVHYDQGYREYVTNAPIHKDKCEDAFKDATFTVLTNDQIAAFWMHAPRGCVILIDECQLVYKARKWQKIMNDDPSLEVYFSQVRKTKDRLYVVSQRWNDFPTFLRDRIQVCHRCMKIPGLKWFFRTSWICNAGKFTQRLGWPKLVTFQQVKEYGQLYDTHGLIGEQASREEAKFALPASPKFPIPKWMLGVAAVLIGFAFMYVKNSLGGGSKPSFLSAKSEKKSVDVESGTRPLSSVGGGLPVAIFDGGKYVSPGNEVLEVRDDTVLIGGPRGMLEVPRDFRAEWNSVHSQTSHVGGTVARSTPATPRANRGRAGAASRPGPFDFQ